MIMQQKKRKIKRMTLVLQELREELESLRDSPGVAQEEMSLYLDASVAFLELLQELWKLLGYYETHSDA